MRGCLLFHGFTGCPDEVLPLAQYIQERTDWLVHVPTLPGHGPGGDLKEVVWQDWLLFAEREFLRMSERCEEVFVIGFSMGGLLATHLSVKFDPSVSRLVLLAPALFQPNTSQIWEDLVKLVREYPKEGKQIKEQLERYKRKISTTPLRAVYQFRKLVKEVSASISLVKSPCLIIQGKKDDVVLPESATYIYEHIQSQDKELLFLPESKHMLCHDIEKEELYQAVERFLLVKENVQDKSTGDIDVKKKKA